MHVLGLILFLALLLSPGGVGAQTIEWTKYDNTIPANSDGSSPNGKIPLGSAGTGDDAGAGVSFGLQDGDTYKMWYGGYDGTSYRIYYATSANGLEWAKLDNTIPANSDGSSTNGKIPLGTGGKGDDAHATYVSVLKDGATYKMWYAGHDGAFWRIYYATSSNGLEWTKLDNNIPANSDGSSTNGKIPLGSAGTGDDAGTINPSVLKDGATYKMWYAGYDGANWRIYYATSSNGLEWTKLDNNIPANSDGSSTNGKIPMGSNGKGDDSYVEGMYVLKDGDTYKMWYIGDNGGTNCIYHASSSNGLEWTKLDNTVPPVSDTTNSNSRLGLGSNTKGDDTHVGYPVVVPREFGRGYQLWYSGHDGTSWRIYYATKPPPTGTIYTLK